MLHTEQHKLADIHWVTSQPLKVDDSTFQAFAVRLQHKPTVELTYMKVRQAVPNADHIMVAYCTQKDTGSCNDGEYYGDLQILKTIQRKALSNIAIFVTRKKGLLDLGPKHFQAIRSVVEEVIQILECDHGQPVDQDWNP